MVKIIDKQNRSILGEGRSYQMGFAFLKKEKDGVFKTVQPISPCKDYLNDVVYSEKTGKPVSAYGLHYEKQDIYDADRAYMVIRIMENFSGSKYSNFDKDTQNLKDNYKTLQNFINHFEAQLGAEPSEIIDTEENGRFFISLPLLWCETTYLISLYSLLLRVGQFFKGDKSPEEYIAKFTEFQPDTYLLSSAKPKLEKILKSTTFEQNMDKFYGGTDVHNHGIVAHNL